jgi:hypothetical protein
MAGQVGEAVAIRRDHHVALAHYALVRRPPAPEGEEHWVLVERRGGAFAAPVRGRLLRLGQEDDPLTIGADPNRGCLLRTLGTVAVGRRAANGR